MLKSMRSRMTIWFVLLLIPFLLVTSYTGITLTTKAADDKVREALGKVRDRAQNDMKDPSWKEKLRGLVAEPSVRQLQVGILVRDRDDQIVFYPEKKFLPPEVFEEAQPSGATFRKLFDKWRMAPGRYHQLRLAVFMPRKPSDSALPQALLAISVIVLGAVGAGAWFMVGRVLSPIASLAKQTSQASAENLSVRLETPSKDAEMRDLVDTLNGLLDRVYETAELKGRFYAAASHELRTPLQALSGHLELAASRKRTAEEYEAVVKESYTQTRRLISLVQSLLFLHQVDSRTHSRQELVNLTDLCEGALEMVYGQVQGRKLHVSEDLEPGVQVEAVPSHAEVLTRNLIENAVKYTTEGGEVSIQLKHEGSHVLFEVENDYPESLKIATEHIFEPFYRDDVSRNSKTGGNGLGLAICRAVCIANGWTVSFNQIGGKIRAVVDFGSEEPAKDEKPERRSAARLSKPATA